MSWGSRNPNSPFEVRAARTQVWAFIKSLAREEQVEVIARLDSLAIDPSRDGVGRITLPYPPAIFGVDVVSRFWIVYHVHGRIVDVYNIDRASVSAPAPW